MSKEVDDTDYWAWLSKQAQPPDIADAWDAGRAAEQVRCLAAVEAERITHICRLLPDCEDCRYNQAIDDALAVIRGDEGRGGK